MEQLPAISVLEVLEDVAHENQFVPVNSAHEHPRAPDENLVVNKAMHLRQVGRVAFNAINSSLPVLALIARRGVLGFEDVSVFAKQVAPFAEAHAHVENGLRF